MDIPIRLYCETHNIVFQPYASMRNLAAVGGATKRALTDAASAHQVTPYAVALRFLLQTGAQMIPRSSRLSHLKENIQVFDFALTEEEMRKIGPSYTGKVQNGGPGEDL